MSETSTGFLEVLGSGISFHSASLSSRCLAFATFLLLANCVGPIPSLKNSFERLGAEIAVLRHKTGSTRHSLSDHCARLKSSWTWKDWILILAIRGHEV